MISKGFKDKVKELLYRYYKIQCDKIVSLTDMMYSINAKNQSGQTLYLTLDIHGNEFGSTSSTYFKVYIDGDDVINQKLFMIDKIQSAMNKSLEFLKDIKANSNQRKSVSDISSLNSLKLESRNDNYVFLSGGCSMGRSYLNITYTIPYSEDNGFILFGNRNLYKIADIDVKVSDCQFNILDEAKSLVSHNYLTDFNFNLKDGDQTALEDYILKVVFSYDLALYSCHFTDMETLNFFKSLKYDLISYENIEYLKDFYTVIDMIEV